MTTTTTKISDFTRQMAQDLANQQGKPFAIFVENRMEACVQVGLREVPADAEIVHPAPGSVPRVVAPYRLPNFGVGKR